MELTRKAEYAVRGMLYLGKHQEGQLAMLGDIADAMDAPRTFLAKIFQDLAKKGLVKSSKGIRGGFVLARPPEKITLCEIVEAIEGPIMPNKCLIGEGFAPFKKHARSIPCGGDSRQLPGASWKKSL